VNAQAAAALKVANRVRLARAAFRAELRSLPAGEGLALLAASFEDAAWCAAGPVASERVEVVLSWPRVEGAVAQECLAVIGCSEFRRVNELTERQRAAGVTVLRHFADRASGASDRRYGAPEQGEGP